MSAESHERVEARRADLGRYFTAARRAGVTRRVADKALAAAGGNIADAWAALGRRARGEA